MPTYEYRCKSCGEQLEVVQSFTDDSLTECEVCGGPLRKVFGTIGITFKGSGFYKTDSRAGASSSKSSESTSSKTESSDSSSSSSDSGTTKTATESKPASSDSKSKSSSAPASAS